MFETMTDSDRKVKFQVALALFAAIALALLTIWSILTGWFGGRASLGSLVLTVSCFAALFHWKQMPLRVAFTLIGRQSAIRAILSRMQVSSSWLHVAGLAGKMINLLGFIIIIFVILKWFEAVRRNQPSSEREKVGS